MFSDVELYRVLRRDVAPTLRTWPFCRVWHAGISTLADVFSTAIVLHEEGVLRRATIYATDADEARIDAGRRGDLMQAEPSLTQEDRYEKSGGRSRLDEYYRLDGGVRIKQSILDHMVWSSHDPSTEASFNEFQLIIYDCTARSGVAQPVPEVVHGSLSRSGVLMLMGQPSLGAHALLSRYEVPWGNASVLRRIW